MKRTTKQSHELSLMQLLQEVQHKMQTATLSVSQQQSLTEILLHIVTETHIESFPRPDMQDIRGQAHVKRVLEVAAAGRHHILLVGPPGAGKAMLARTLPSLLPATGWLPPLRELDGTLREDALFGMSNISETLLLAQSGVLFLKELDTFAPSVLTLLTQTMETQYVSSLEDGSILLPAMFLLVATINPCPCGYSGDPRRKCTCTEQAIIQYREPLKECVRTCFALEIEVPLIEEAITYPFPEESSASVRQRVEMARQCQQRRYVRVPHLWVNADLTLIDEVEHYCPLEADGKALLKEALHQLHLTPRQVVRVQTVARTIADLTASPTITARHLAEAIQYLSRFIY